MIQSLSEKLIEYYQDEVTLFVQAIHDQIYGQFLQQVQKFRLSGKNAVTNEDYQAQIIEKFLNNINMYSKYHDKNLNATPNFASLEQEIGYNLLQTELYAHMGNAFKSLFQGAGYRKQFTDEDLGHYMENLITKSFNQLFSNQIIAKNVNTGVGAVNIGKETGLPTLTKQIEKELIYEASSIITDNLQADKNNKKNTGDSFWEYISMSSYVSNKALKADVAIPELHITGQLTQKYQELIQALSGATFSIKAYQSQENYNKIYKNGLNEGFLSLGSTKHSISIMPYFLTNYANQLAKTLFFGKHGITNKQLLSIYTAAMHLSNTDPEVRKSIEDLSWIYDLMGSSEISYNNQTLNWVEQCIAASGGVKFFIFIDTYSGQISVKSTKTMALDMLMGEIKDPLRVSHFNTKKQNDFNHKENVISMSYFGFYHRIYQVKYKKGTKPRRIYRNR